MIDVTQLEGFDWGNDNDEKNWLKHTVTPMECEEIFFNIPLLLSDDINPSQDELRCLALGKTNQGRYLFISFTVRKKCIRVISARDMTKKERGSYQSYT
jgi:uncharacterized protein